MQPGLARAVPMGILGFIGGAILVMIIRGLQSVDPIWDPQIGLVVAGFITSATFVWGMGALNPSVNQHAHEPEIDETGLIVAETHDEHEEVNEDVRKPINVLGYSIWEVTFWTIALMVALFGFATLEGGPALRVSNDPDASPQEIGYYSIDLPFDGPHMEVSQFLVFILFGGFAILSLVITGGAIGYGFASLATNVREAKASDPIPLGTTRLALPAPNENKATASLTPKSTMMEIARNAIVRGLPFAVVFGVAFFLLDSWMRTTGIAESPRLWAVITEWVATLPTWIASVVALILSLIIANVITYSWYNSRNDLVALHKATLAFGLTIFLYWAFYYVLIYYPLYGVARILGWNDGPPPNVITVLSLVNAIAIVVPLIFPWYALRGLSRSARALAHTLRGAPEFLGQK